MRHKKIFLSVMGLLVTNSIFAVDPSECGVCGEFELVYLEGKCPTFEDDDGFELLPEPKEEFLNLDKLLRAIRDGDFSTAEGCINVLEENEISLEGDESEQICDAFKGRIESPFGKSCEQWSQLYNRITTRIREEETLNQRLNSSAHPSNPNPNPNQTKLTMGELLVEEIILNIMQEQGEIK